MHAHAVTYSPHWLSMPVLTQEPHTASQLACVKCLAHLSLPVDDQDAYTRTVVIYNCMLYAVTVLVNETLTFDDWRCELSCTTVSRNNFFTGKVTSVTA